MAKSEELSESERKQCDCQFQNKPKAGNSGRKNITSICALTLVIILLLIIIVILLQRQNVPVTVNILSEATLIQNETAKQQTADFEANSTGSVNFVSRSEWFALPPVHSLDLLNLPVPLVIIHHTATKECVTQKECTLQVRSIQNFHTEYRKWSDIGYNFLIGGDGEVYEGRGWKYQGAHTYRYNSKSIGIAFIGNFNTVKPPEAQMFACKKLIEKGVEIRNIKRNYTLLGARQLISTISPGWELYKEIKKWGHWGEVP